MITKNGSGVRRMSPSELEAGLHGMERGTYQTEGTVRMVTEFSDFFSSVARFWLEEKDAEGRTVGSALCRTADEDQNTYELYTGAITVQHLNLEEGDLVKVSGALSEHEGHPEIRLVCYEVLGRRKRSEEAPRTEWRGMGPRGNPGDGKAVGDAVRMAALPRRR